MSINPASATITCATPMVSLSAVDSGTYRWSTGATTRVISATSATTYSVTLTGTNDCSSTASVSVGVDQTPPSLTLRPSIGTPIGTTLTCTNPVVSLSAIGVGSPHWSAGATMSSISVSTANTYSVTLIGFNGCSASASITVMADQTAPAIIINPSSETLTCATPVVSLNAVGEGNYRWSTGATTQTISATSATTYSVTLTGANGCTATASVQVFQNIGVPTVSINPSFGTQTGTTLTCATSMVSLTAVGTGTVRWENNTSTTARSVAAAGTYSVTVTGANGCTAMASTTITPGNTPPSVSIGTPTGARLSCTMSSVSLSAVGTGTYRWSTGSTTSVISATSVGIYSVTLTGSNGCTATASINVIYQNCAPTLANAIPPKSATIGDAFSYIIPLNTFSDLETPNSLTLSVVGLPTGLSFVAPATITGTPSTTVGSPSSVTVVATDPGELSVSTSFVLTVMPRSFAIKGVTMLDCNHISYFERRINFTVSFEATNGQPISLSVVNEARTVAIDEPFQLTVYTDNPVIVFKARQQGTLGEATFAYNWLAHCANAPPRRQSYSCSVGHSGACVHLYYSRKHVQ